MTGFLDRLRAWLGSFFGNTAVDDDPSDDADPQFEGSAPTVAHRDDRPLETPDTLSLDAERQAMGSDTGDSGGSDEGGPNRVDIPDAEDGTASTVDPETEVSIPDAELGEHVDSAVSGGARPAAETPDAEDGTETHDAEFVCSVCGTGVDDPNESCPLCQSTDVVPAGGSESGPSRRGRTDTAEADGEAVDRLRDMQGE